MGDCRLCGPEAGFLRGLHRKCHSLQESGWDEMEEMATRTAESSGFSQAPLRLDLMAVPQRSFYDGTGINAAIAGGWHRAVSSSMADGILSLEKERLRDFRDQFSVQGGGGAGVTLVLGGRDRVMLDARPPYPARPLQISRNWNRRFGAWASRRPGRENCWSRLGGPRLKVHRRTASCRWTRKPPLWATPTNFGLSDH